MNRDQLRIVQVKYIKVDAMETLLAKDFKTDNYHLCMVIDFDTVEDKHEFLSLYNDDNPSSNMLVYLNDAGLLCKSVYFNNKLETEVLDIDYINNLFRKYIPDYEHFDFFKEIEILQERYNKELTPQTMDIMIADGVVDGVVSYMKADYVIDSLATRYKKDLLEDLIAEEKESGGNWGNIS